MKVTPYRKLAMPISRFNLRYGKGKSSACHWLLVPGLHGKASQPLWYNCHACFGRLDIVVLCRPHCLHAEVGPNMISACNALFGRSYGECCLDDLPKLAQSARDVPGTWVTVQCQHRWFLMAKALQSHNRTTKSALNNDTQLWAMLGRVTDAVGRLVEGVPHNNHMLCVHVNNLLSTVKQPNDSI